MNKKKIDKNISILIKNTATKPVDAPITKEEDEALDYLIKNIKDIKKINEENNQ